MSLPVDNVAPSALRLFGRKTGRTLVSRAVSKLRRIAAAGYQRGRSLTARTVYSVPLLAAKNPRSRIKSCKAFCNRVDGVDELDVGDDRYLSIREGETLFREPSLCLDEDEAEKFSRGTQKYQGGKIFRCPEVFLASFKRATVEGRDGTIIAQNGEIVFESALSEMASLEKNGILDQILPIWPDRMSGRFCHFAHPSAYCYYHWMIEQLPKLVTLSRLADAKSLSFLVPHTLNNFQKASLKIAGVSPEQCVPLSPRGCQVDRLYFSEMNAPTGSPSPAAVKWLRETFMDDPSPRLGDRRVYLTRRDAPQRRVLNEDDIVERLVERGFEVVCAGDLSVSEQVEMFRDVRIVVAPHGAALTNMVFTSPGALIVEMFGENYINGCYWALANICGHNHAFVTAPSDTLDYIMPVDKIACLLKKLDIA